MADIAHTPLSTGSFYRSRIASLLAIAPLGVWTALHLWTTSAPSTCARLGAIRVLLLAMGWGSVFALWRAG